METITIHTDSSIKEEKFYTAAIIKINEIDNIKIRHEYSRKLNHYKNDSHFAESLAINTVIEYMINHPDKFMNKRINLYNDNKTCIEKFKNAKIKQKGFKRNLKRIETILNSKIYFMWIPREENTEADKLCEKYFV